MRDDFSAALETLERSGDRPEGFGAPFVDVLPVTGASVSTLGDLLGSETVSATDSRAAWLDEVQFDLGEGPCWDAMRAGRPVAETQIRLHGAARWPAFASAVRESPVRSIFAFPLVVGPLQLGAVDLYSIDPVELDERQSQLASAMADVIGRHLLRGALDALEDVRAMPNPRSRRVVHQATGVVLAQLDIPPEDAALIIQGHAFASGRSMMDVADDVVGGRLRFRRVDGRIEVAP